MSNRKIVFTAPWTVEIQEDQETSAAVLAPDEVRLQKIYSLISPGTELACLSGGESWFPFPDVPGYASVSRVLEAGESVEHIKAGDNVFHYGTHSSEQIVKAEGVLLRVPDGIDLKWVPFTRMATVAMTSLRVSQIELGDFVTVTGLGLVGNMASQLAGLQGAHVIGLDLSEERLRIAKACGVAHTIHSGKEQAIDIIKQLTNGIGSNTHIEATGVPKVAVDSLPWIAPFGELILLGSPRGEYITNVTDVLNYSHLIGRGCITFKGAHEWRYSVEPNPFVKHSLVRNSQVVFQLMKEGKLHIEPLLSHVLRPEQAEEAYFGLRDKKDEYSGVLFDWQAE
ncbi:alcohol dehydrogenase [Paenibacillaceae bacterium]|nr:alcohol dehydrogenase [Paenibacillaceae bacterium]